jgi:hypothetical protein
MPEPIPEFYIDQFRVTVGPFGGAMTFGLSDPHPSPGQIQPPQDTVRIRMSLEHMKVMAMLMKRQVKAYEEQTASPVNIPRQVYNNMGLSQEDW